jgi:NAD-dependent SIR2 family protein deacetylase
MIDAQQMMCGVCVCVCVQDLFSLEFFRQDQRPFYDRFAAMCVEKQPTLAHFLAPFLSQKDALLRNYTQNVDCLDRQTGLDLEQLIEASSMWHVNVTFDKSSFFGVFFFPPGSR